LSNTFDFDDLLVFSAKLFKQFPSCVSQFEHILVDEVCSFYEKKKKKMKINNN